GRVGRGGNPGGKQSGRGGGARAPGGGGRPASPRDPGAVSRMPSRPSGPNRVIAHDPARRVFRFPPPVFRTASPRRIRRRWLVRRSGGGARRGAGGRGGRGGARAAPPAPPPGRP